ncbi:MAG: succinylglutamate desuccinylase [Mesorhizobium sp.]|uniref:succinylglutamate desuccinylase/aspartoacylase family protein n=2 Tax=Mesorhizobium TaxID=68287 RepID=UPI000FCAD7C9|nr:MULTISPECIES: succinylglutamate desuccinylase/aspartoacylase family protein [unclassified Mesorhizobium]MCT2581094.1 succinylglutamate desuccinylase/aspartoacylase family protein [Mesorhizobium sp. P13.3]MDF3170146.1 succinylglutamate desuccinylase/aspartoacylase family protein [Mesorhizobium sp. P16.1]MDF3181092.1 succinylglutamate desuccinylase/aspartoacylase family protein [Mesorhizobium sp. P17.1]MDF3187007.1 succinylglutamate desuccinylase/aspartoacylase family protein [Mesorhizobium sp
MKSRVWTTINFDAPGIQSDFARVPYSSDTSAYGWIPVPMLCFNGGKGGPTALLTAGTHGDEYEGQVALRKLVRELAVTKLQGRVIILPALNLPAVAAGRRTSPLDGGNLNRVFPGNPEGGPTAAIAHYVTTELFPLADLVIDLHSGGSSLDYLLMALARPGRNQGEAEAIRRLLKSFGAPYSLVTDGANGGAGATLYAAAEQQGIPALTTELGSGSTLSEPGLVIAESGLRRVLRDHGIAPDMEAPEAPVTRIVRSLGPADSIYSPCDGLFEPFAKPGERVSSGQMAGCVHRLDDALLKPVELTFPAAGIVAFRRFLTLSSTGDLLFGVMTEAEN